MSFIRIEFSFGYDRDHVLLVDNDDTASEIVAFFVDANKQIDAMNIIHPRVGLRREGIPQNVRGLVKFTGKVEIKHPTYMDGSRVHQPWSMLLASNNEFVVDFASQREYKTQTNEPVNTKQEGE